MSVGILLDRLDNVKQIGPDRWIARCPAHDDRSPSLSLRDVGDRVLLHCFAGCEALDVVHAVGLELADLFDGPLADEFPERRRRRIPPGDILKAIDHEAVVMACITADFLKYSQLDPEMWTRLATACARIGAARDLAR